MNNLPVLFLMVACVAIILGWAIVKLANQIRDAVRWGALVNAVIKLFDGEKSGKFFGGIGRLRLLLLLSWPIPAGAISACYLFHLIDQEEAREKLRAVPRMLAGKDNLRFLCILRLRLRRRLKLWRILRFVVSHRPMAYVVWVLLFVWPRHLEIRH